MKRTRFKNSPLTSDKINSRNQMAKQVEFIIDNYFNISSKEREDLYALSGQKEIEYDGWYWHGHKSYEVLGERPEICLHRCNIPMTLLKRGKYKRGTVLIERVWIYLANEDGTCSDKRPELNVSISPSGKWSVGEFRRTIW